MGAERSVLSNARIICSFVLCLMLCPISGKILPQCSISQLQKIHGELNIWSFFIFLGCTSLLLKAYEGVFPEFRVLMTSTKQNAELPAVDREMESTCTTAQVPREVLASWEFISSPVRGWVQSDHGLGGSVSSGYFPTICCLVRGTGPLAEEIAFPQVWQLSLCFPSHQSGWHFTGKMLSNSTAVPGWYIQPVLGHCC